MNPKIEEARLALEEYDAARCLCPLGASVDEFGGYHCPECGTVDGNKLDPECPTCGWSSPFLCTKAVGHELRGDDDHAMLMGSGVDPELLRSVLAAYDEARADAVAQERAAVERFLRAPGMDRYAADVHADWISRGYHTYDAKKNEEERGTMNIPGPITLTLTFHPDRLHGPGAPTEVANLAYQFAATLFETCGECNIGPDGKRANNCHGHTRAQTVAKYITGSWCSSMPVDLTAPKE